ncbi:sugar transport protein 14 [Coffea eugenioides]|uniref:sugar transport protein 14 n=1 Tax=Coffea eugenioides TaxID=49369 RepID=UPI000F60F210|nr:sugar transport protein 14 [Coffea eugenioides]
MAGGAFVDGGGSRAAHYEYKITSYFITACLIGSFGGSLFGYDLGVSGGVTSMDDFLIKFFPKVYERKHHHLTETDYCKYDNQVLTLFTSSLYYAALLSTLGVSYVTRNKGRRMSIMCGAVSFFAGGLINAAAENIAMLIIGRCLLGVGIGFGNQAVPLYLSEMAPAKIRGAVNQLFQLTTCLGILVANLINYGVQSIHPWGWRLALGLAMVPAAIMFVGGLFAPETPNSLVEQGKLDEARKVLEKVRGTPNVDAEFADLLEASEAARAIKNPFSNLLKRKNRPQLIIGSLGIPAFQQLTGNNSILFYAPVIFQSLGFGSNASLYSSVITNGALVVAALISMSLVDKFGRRKFFLEAGCEMIITMVAVGVTLALKFGKGEELSKGISAFLVIMIFVFVLAYGRSWGPLGWLVPSEIFPLETRSAGQSIVVSVNMLFTALVAQFFLKALCGLKFGIFLLFAGLIIFMSCFVYFLLPETKQVPIEEIYLLWQSHWFWKRYCAPDGNEDGQEIQKPRKPNNETA